jgi:filamentous hemagglutinin family protein
MPTAPFRLRPTVCFILMALPALARTQTALTAPTALPTNGTVTSGIVTLQQDAATLRVNQASDKAIVNWDTFNIGRDAAVQFVQPGAGSTILNRVLGGPSDIAGKLTSNGRVYLVNPNGVLFGSSARVDVGSLVVAAGSVSDSSYLAGAPQVATSGRVENAGSIVAADGGSVVLAGTGVGNSGTIGAPNGAITLAAGDAVRINLSSDGLIQAQVTLAAPHAAVANNGTLESAGGHIALAASGTAGGAGGLVIDSGIVRAGAVRSNGGTVSLIGGSVEASGSIDTSSAQGTAGNVNIFGDLQVGGVRFDASVDARGAAGGGIVETSAARVRAGSKARVNTLAANGRHGTWLIDPQDFTIGDAPGDDMSSTVLSNSLEQGNVTIQSVAGARSGAGDIHVNTPIVWGTGTTLTLTAENSILFASGAIQDPFNPNGARQAYVSAAGDNAGLALNFGNRYQLGENTISMSGLAPRVTINGTPFAVLTASLGATGRLDPAGNYVLVGDVDAGDTYYANNGLGWEPLGTVSTPFSGQFHGFGHVIRNLSINRSGSSDVGFIGALTGTVRDLGLVDPNVAGGERTGALVGSVRSGNAAILNTHVAGGSVSSVTGGESSGTAGGLVGAVMAGASDPARVIIDGSYSSGVFVSGAHEGTGLVGDLNIYSKAAIGNSFYNASDEGYGESALGPGAILGEQFAMWLAGGRKLRIADFGASLPYDAASGSYGVGSLQSVRDLLGFANAGVKLRLTNDLDFSEAPGLFLPTFNGQFDGAGHSIAKLRLDASDRVPYAGLVGTNTGTIRNLNLVDASIDGQVAGGIAGANLGTIQNTSVSGSVRGIDSVGGLVGFQVLNGALLDSASTASIAGESSLGGVIGDFDSGTLRNTHYNADAVPINDSTSGLSMGGLRSAQYNEWIANGRRLDIASYGNVLPRDAASGAYLVSSAAGVNAMLGFVDDPGLTFRLNADIDLAPAPGLFLPYLMGTLDGNGHRISNVSVVSPQQQYLGLVGVNYGTVRNLGATNVTVDGLYYVGGLVGRNQAGARIETSFSSGTVHSRFTGAGGLAGANFGAIANSYSSANVGGAAGQSGGLAGTNNGSIGTSLATGVVGTGNGGLVGRGNGAVSNSFWNTQTSGAATSAGGTGKITAELQSLATYTGWDFGRTWRMVDGTPSLRTFTAGQYDLVVDALDLRRVYGSGPVRAQDLSVSFTGFQGSDTQAQLTGQLAYGGDGINGIGAINAGSYSVLPGGLASSKYDIVYLPGTVTIDRAPLVLSADNKGKVYGDPDPALSFSASGLQYGDTAGVLSGVVLSAPRGAAASAGSHAIAIEGGGAANYTVVTRTPGLLTVAPRPLLLTADDKAMTLNDPPPAFTWRASGLQYADTVGLVSGVRLSSNVSAVGQQPILLEGGDAGPNYSVNRANGTLVVAPPVLVETPPPVVTPPALPPVPDAPPAPIEALAAIQSQAAAPASLVPPPIPNATAAGSIALAASVAGGATPQRKQLFMQAGDAITRNPAIGTLKTCGDTELDDCIARPRTAFQAQVTEDTGGAAPAMHIKRKLALVIGNNDYRSPLPYLEGAGRDARAVGGLLQRQGYQVDQLINADRSGTIAALNRLIRTSEPDDSVLVFYAGHGYIHPGSSVGYWIPTGATIDDPRGWLSNIDIARFLANMPARQLLLVSDSCFSGALTREGIAEEQRAGMSRNAILMRRSVVALSSGGEEVVADSALDGHSPFTWHLLRQLEAAKGEIPARDMLLSIRDEVSKSSDGQVPAYGIILSSGHASGGEYLLNPKTN